MNKQQINIRGQHGQTTLVIVLALSVFLFGFIALAVDFSNLWFHRQTAQTAADAACEAGAMDVLLSAQGYPVDTTNAGFTPGSGFNCSTAVTSPNKSPSPCVYASLNGYAGGGLLTSPNRESNEVAVSFPGTIPNVTVPPAAIAPVPFLQVDVTDRVRVFFSAMFTGNRTQDVRASARCGLQLAKAPIPIIVLHPTKSASFNITGNPLIHIYGGPKQSIQVNSESTTAVQYPWGNSLVDLSQGGSNLPPSGSDFGTFGGPVLPPCTPNCSNLNLGTTGTWLYQSPPISDPFAGIPVPTTAGMTTNPTPDTGVTYAPAPATATTDPYCPVPTGSSATCKRYYPGNYPDGITITNENALFAPGVYYLGSGTCTGTGSSKCDLTLGSNSLARPSAFTNGNTTGGTMFYFSGHSTLQLGSNSGGGNFPGSVTPTPFPNSDVQCPSGAPPVPAITDVLAGNVFLGPCTGTYGDPLAQYRGMLFFHDRTVATDNVLNGGGGILVAGNLYFHQNTSFGTTLGLWGGSCSNTRILGDIIVDELDMQGNSCINMQLNPNAAYNILKVALLQ